MVRLKDKILEVGGAAIFVGGLQPKITIEVEVTEAQRKIRELLGLSETLKGSLSGVGVRFPAGKATGGPVDAGTPYIVGEKGPELFVPAGYGRIMDAFSTNKALLSNAGGSMGGGGSNVTINVSVSPTADKASIGQTIVEAISSYERRSGSGWRY
jgi:Flp pilus assembly secretin CpaC